MKISLLALALLLSLDGALYWGLRRLTGEKEDLARRRDELSRQVEARRQTGERGLRSEALLRSGSQGMGRVDRALDIAELRDLLLGAERSLDIDRFSLDFRPAQDAPKGREGGRVSANLGGSFDALYDYLARVENLRLPLRPDTLSLRAEDPGRIRLAIEWNGLWSGENLILDELSPSDVARLEAWLASDPAPRPARDLFSEGVVSTVAADSPPLAREIPARPEPSAASPTDATEPSSAKPRLTGFIIARPELEPDVNRRVLAALRFEGELRLAGLGETVGSYLVEEINARESVVLVHQESGERVKLFLE
jgi:hypothetical protein